MDAATAADTSAAWGGDRGVLVTNGDRSAFGWDLQYDRAAHAPTHKARLAFDSVKAALEKALGRAAISDAAFVCHERPDRGPLAVGYHDNRLVFVLGPVKTSGARWTSAGSCALSRAWAHEIEVQK
jgi:hypothetical protein